MLSRIAAALISVVFFALLGCSTVTRGVDETVTFDSQPSGATMRSVYDTHCGACMADSPEQAPGENDPPPIPGPACITPCSLIVPRNKVLVATFTKDGYEPETLYVRWKLPPQGAAGFVGNALIGGVVGLAIDAGTGASLDHTPNPAIAVLRPTPRAQPEQVAPTSKKKNRSKDQSTSLGMPTTKIADAE